MAQPTPLEASLGALIMAFHKHAGSGDAKTLKLPNRCGDDLMTMLDQDGDGALNFMEYLTLIWKMCLHFMKRPACFHLLSTVYCIRPTCHTNVSYLIE
uniref:EF-hand domain-containing protein n=1 Tax=Hucho hucho TaxID=62062 RepID=A0A4W5RR33_9TELE